MGWDRDPLLQCLHLDTPLLEQQNTKKLYGTENNSVHAQLGKILEPKDTKRPKTPTATFEGSGTKTGGWEQKQGTAPAPAHSTTEEWANHLSHPSSLTPEHILTLTPYKEPVHPALGSKQARGRVVCS